MAVKNKIDADAVKPVSADAPGIQSGIAPTQEANPRRPDDAAGFCCYIGPNILGVIQSGSIYPGTREEALAAIAPAVEKYPLIASLVVDGETLPTDRIKVKTPGNHLFVCYTKLAAGKK